MRSWVEPSEIPIPEDLHRAIGGHPLVSQTLARRGLSDLASARAFLDPAYYTPASPSELPGMAQAADRLEAAIRSGEGMLVWGDFDVDGQTATTLLVSALRGLGGMVEYHIPVRALESHGVKLEVLQGLLEGGRGAAPPGVVVTCDTGIGAHQSVAYAQGCGVDVVITDHHELPPELPRAYAVVNPKLLDQAHPMRGLPGVGVAYKLAEELYRRAGRSPEMEQFLDLAALGVVADVAPLRGEARCLLQRGLELLRAPQRVGLQAIYERAELDPTWLSEEHIAFVLAPRLNALGRLSDANPAVELLTTQEMGRARLLALQLEGLNSQRQLLTSQVLRGALAQIEQDRSLLEGAVLVLAHPAWEAGVIGIVASRLVELFGKPAVLIAAPPGGLGRGSARSVQGVDITAAIAFQAGLLLGYGGHPMAAGFSIETEKIPEFRRGLGRAVEKMTGEADRSVPTVNIDAYLDWGNLSLELALDLERLAPFGAGNPALALASRGLRLASHSTVGREKEHLLLTVEDETGLARRVIWWSGGDYLEADQLPQGLFDLAYTLRASTFRGQRDLQLEWVDFRPVETAIVLEARPLEVVDYRTRDEGNREHLQQLASDPTLSPMQVWAEGIKVPGSGIQGVDLRTRNDLSPCKTLVIWTTPPGPVELQAALERTRPEKAALFGVEPGMGQLQVFLERLAGLVKYAISKEAGRVRIDMLAAALAQREITVRKGLEWLEARGDIEEIKGGMEGEEVVLSVGGKANPERARLLLEEIRMLLEETRAYRAWFGRAEEVLDGSRRNRARRVTRRWES